MLNFLEKSRLSWLITIVIAIFIFYISSLSLYQVGPEIGGNTNSFVYHFFIFFWFAFFLSLSLIRGKKINLLIIVILIAAIYAGSDEFHQLFVLNRNCSFSDFLTDLAGAFFAILIYTFSIKIRKLNL